MDAPPRPHLRSIVLDTPDPRGLAEFYRQLLGWAYRPGDEPPGGDGAEDPPPGWLVLRNPDGWGRLAIQHEPEQRPSTWPDHDVPMQLHLDLTVPTVEALVSVRQRAQALGAQLRLDRFDDPDEPLYVLADTAGHPFCIFVAADDEP